MRAVAGALIVMAGAFLCGVGAVLNAGASSREGVTFGGVVLILTGLGIVAGGLHVLSCPGECAPHGDALAVGEGVQLWPRILRDAEAGRLRPRYDGDYRVPYRDDPPPRRDLVPRGQFLTTTSLIATRGCHSRCGFCYLSTEGLHMPYLVRDAEQIAA